MFTKKALFVVTILFALLFVANNTVADVIFDGFYDGDNYVTSYGAGLHDSLNAYPVDLDQGYAFTPTGSNYTLEGIELAVGYIYRHNESELDVWLMTDAGGVPDAILESFHFNSSEMGQFGYNNPLLAQDSISNPILEEDTQYWLVGSASGPDSYLAWNRNVFYIQAPHVVRWDMGDWNLEQMDHGAFRIYGTPVSSEPPVPEPTSLVLLGLGLVGMALKRRVST